LSIFVTAAPSARRARENPSRFRSQGTSQEKRKEKKPLKRKNTCDTRRKRRPRRRRAVPPRTAQSGHEGAASTQVKEVFLVVAALDWPLHGINRKAYLLIAQFASRVMTIAFSTRFAKCPPRVFPRLQTHIPVRISHPRDLPSTSMGGNPQFCSSPRHTNFSLLDGACETGEASRRKPRARRCPPWPSTYSRQSLRRRKLFYSHNRDVIPSSAAKSMFAGQPHENSGENSCSPRTDRGEMGARSPRSNHLVSSLRQSRGYHNRSSWSPRDPRWFLLQAADRISTCSPTRKD